MKFSGMDEWWLNVLVTSLMSQVRIWQLSGSWSGETIIIIIPQFELRWEGLMARCWTGPGDPITITIRVITTLTIRRRYSSQSPSYIRDPRDTSHRSCDIAVRKLTYGAEKQEKFGLTSSSEENAALIIINLCLVGEERFPWPLLVLYSISIMTTLTISQRSQAYLCCISPQTSSSRSMPFILPALSPNRISLDIFELCLRWSESLIWWQSLAINDIIPRTLQGPRDSLVTPGQCRLC